MWRARRAQYRQHIGRRPTWRLLSGTACASAVLDLQGLGTAAQRHLLQHRRKQSGMQYSQTLDVATRAQYWQHSSKRQTWLCCCQGRLVLQQCLICKALIQQPKSIACSTDGSSQACNTVRLLRWQSGHNASSIAAGGQHDCCFPGRLVHQQCRALIYPPRGTICSMDRHSEGFATRHGSWRVLCWQHSSRKAT